MVEYLLAAGAAVLMVGGVFSICQLFRLVKTDAECRGLQHPNLWGFLSISGNSQGGLILYLIARRKHPIISMTAEQRALIETCKRKIGVGLIFLVIGAFACIWSIVLI